MLQKLSFKREIFYQGLAIIAFVLFCALMARSLSPRESCVQSSFIAFARLGDVRVENCAFESRLFPTRVDLSSKQRRQLLELQALESLLVAFPKASPILDVVLPTEDSADSFAHRSALIAAVLNEQAPQAVSDEEELAVVSDYLNLTLFGPSEQARAEKFSTVVLSPTKLRQLLAQGLYRIYDGLSLQQKFKAMARLRQSESLPALAPFPGLNATESASWLTTELQNQAKALSLLNEGDDLAVQRALLELGIESPTRWELTMDLTHTPAWRQIVDQMVKRSQFRKKERVLLFTPEGEVALPSRSSVSWTPKDIRSQKHVMVACDWPKAKDAIAIDSRLLFAKKSCDKLSSYFWD